ncbi:tyrosine recombinase [Labeo rohita]|uniref:Tyrosine recombinase n=1 Tax=Labeo rohita TaxID=84645 RepID=A0A498LQC9_LABRO|nr:tyrosine recombinase [Labeo rohita]
MHLWQQFLSSWNGISFFYNDYISQAEDIQLYTDAAPSIGFGGYYSGRWFASEWPPEFSHLAQQSDSPSSTLFEMCSELAPSTSAFNPAIHPSLSDISAHTPDSLIYTLKKSKTDQFGRSCPIYIFRLNSFISAFEPISEYVLSRYANSSSPQEPLFLTENGKMATRLWFNKHFLKVLSASGISPEHYSLHSFRIGAATSAASAGISDETIRVMGRWSSEAYRLYIHNNLNDLHQAQAHISSFKPLGVF